jgi:hypothetical protein
MSIDNKRIIYEDLSGSGRQLIRLASRRTGVEHYLFHITGIETIAHIRENKRITLLFHAFDGPPRLCRIFGTGTLICLDSLLYGDTQPLCRLLS